VLQEAQAAVAAVLSLRALAQQIKDMQVVLVAAKLLEISLGVVVVPVKQATLMALDREAMVFRRQLQAVLLPVQEEVAPGAIREQAAD